MIIFEQINVIEMENKRRDFLKTACAPVVFSMFGISMLEACSSGDDDGYGTTSPWRTQIILVNPRINKPISIDLTRF